MWDATSKHELRGGDPSVDRPQASQPLRPLSCSPRGNSTHAHLRPICAGTREASAIILQTHSVARAAPSLKSGLFLPLGQPCAILFTPRVPKRSEMIGHLNREEKGKTKKDNIDINKSSLAPSRRSFMSAHGKSVSWIHRLNICSRKLYAPLEPTASLCRSVWDRKLGSLVRKVASGRAANVQLVCCRPSHRLSPGRNMPSH